MINFQIYDGRPPSNNAIYNCASFDAFLGLSLRESGKTLAQFYESVVNYVNIHYRLFGSYKGELMRQPNSSTLDQLSGTFKEFLVGKNLTPLIPLFEIIHSAQGYGFLDEIGALYGLMWNTPRWLTSIVLRSSSEKCHKGLNNTLKQYEDFVLSEGFEKVWTNIVQEKQFDIVFNVDINYIDRTNNEVKIYYKDLGFNNYMQRCDFLIWTPPIPKLLEVSRVSVEEYNLFAPLINSNHVYTSSLVRASNTTRNNPIAYYYEPIANKTEHAVTVEMDLKGAFDYSDYGEMNLSQYNEKTAEPRILTVLQLGRHAASKTYLNGIIRRHYTGKFGKSTDIDIFNTIVWPYFYKWSPRELSRGNHWKVFALQGRQRTWYAGASVCFESVKSVMEYNNLLLRQLGNVAVFRNLIVWKYYHLDHNIFSLN